VVAPSAVTEAISAATEGVTETRVGVVTRPWLIVPRRSVAIPGPVAVRRGALSPVLVALGGVREPALVRFPPRYQGAEEPLGRRIGATEIRDGRLVRGLKAAWTWLRDTIRGDGAADLAG